MFLIHLIAILCVVFSKATEPAFTCRCRSNQLRQDGGLCFELPPWQLQPVELEQHLVKLRLKWGNSTTENTRKNQTPFANSEISRYMDTVLAPFLDTYHRNIQNSYQQLTAKILRRIKEELNEAVRKKQEIYTNLTKLADELNLPAMCDEERRAARTLASKHVAQIYDCTEQARASIAKMGKYAEEMISITRNHMESTLDNTRSMDLDQHRNFMKTNVTSCLQELSKAAVTLGYELDLSLTNARRYNEQSCEKLATCSNRARKQSEDAVTDLRNLLYQYAMPMLKRDFRNPAQKITYR